MRALIDTCIIIDALQNREPFSSDAQAIFLLAANQRFNGYITAKSVTDIYYLMHRATHNDKDSRTLLSNLFKLFNPVDTTGIDCKKAIPSVVSDFEDAVMIETANREEMDCIVTRNIHDYSKSNIKIYSPKEFIELVDFYE